MNERICPGLPADWLNGWLAAVGAVCLAPSLRLRWTDDPVPLAVLVAADEVDPDSVLTDAWPTVEDIASLPVARYLDGHRELRLNPSVEAWQERARLARTSDQGWTLSSLFTDLAYDRRERAHVVAKGGLHTPMPGRDNTIHDRIRKLHAAADPPDVARSLDGVGPRLGNYGLGFDLTRIGSLADDASQLVDPVVELLAFFALALFPQRGRDTVHDGLRRTQRGWSGTPQAFRWRTWSAPMAADAIDAFLDAADGGHFRALGATSEWRSVAFQPRGTSDVTRGLGSERVG